MKFKKSIVLGLGMLAAGAYAANGNGVSLIIKYKPSSNTLISLMMAANTTDYAVVKQLNANTAIIEVPEVLNNQMLLLAVNNDPLAQQNREYAVAKQFMDNHPNVLYAIPHNSTMKSYRMDDSKLGSKTGENVTRWDDQWDMHNDQYGIGANGAWGYLKGKQLSATYVAVVDSGLAGNPPKDILKKIDKSDTYFFTMDGNEVVAKRDITDKGSFHGTHVAGTIAANGSTVTGVAGPVSSIKVMPVRALGDDGSGNTYAILDAVKWAVGAGVDGIKTGLGDILAQNHMPVKVINLSLGMSRINPHTKKPQIDDSTWKNNYMVPLCAAWKDAIDAANAHGVTVVIAAGNDAYNLFNDIPSGCQNIDAVVVEASGPTGKLSYYSTYLDSKWAVRSTVVRAPGGDAHYGESGEILSTMNNGYGYMQGTSMATPHVAGLISLIYALNPTADYSYVARVLKHSQNSLGLLNAQSAVQYVLQSKVADAA